MVQELHGPGSTGWTRKEFRAECGRRRGLNLCVRGNTYPYRDMLRRWGAIYSKSDQVWLMPSEEAVAAALRLTGVYRRGTPVTPDGLPTPPKPVPTFREAQRRNKAEEAAAQERVKQSYGVTQIGVMPL